MKNSNPPDTAGDILMRLSRIYRKFSHTRRIDFNSQMCQLWADPTVEIIVGSDELDTIELEFGIKFDDHSALELYNMRLAGAGGFIGKFIKEQWAEEHCPDKFVASMPPGFAKRVLLALWKQREDLRPAISLTAEEVKMLEDK
jgi:hypothetical protein